MIKSLKIYLSDPYYRMVGLVFATNSLLLASWITRLPEIKEKLDIGDGELGMALLGLPVGSILIIPFMGRLTAVYGSGRVTLFSGLAFCLLSPLIVLAPGLVLFIAALTLLGIATGAMDVAMNATAAAIEKKKGHAIMATSHGMWSLGAMSGAGITSLLAGMQVSASLQMMLSAGLMFFVVYALKDKLLGIKDSVAGPVRFALPGRSVLGLALISFCIMLGEGAIMDWSTVYIRHTLMADAFYSGLGFAGFSLSMAIGRFFGDRILDRLGAGRVVLWGAMIGLVGLSTALFLPNIALAIAGFTLAGLGFSCLIPSLYASAARVPGQSPAKSIAEVAGLGYFGLFAGPPTIGLVAERYGLDIALGLVLILLVLVVLTAGNIKFYR